MTTHRAFLIASLLCNDAVVRTKLTHDRKRQLTDNNDAANIILQLRHNLFNIATLPHVLSFTVGALYFPDNTNQIKKLFDSKKGASRGNSNEWFLRPKVRPIKRYGGFASLRVEKENSPLHCQVSHVIYFKFDISVGMKGVNDPKGFVIKVLQGCS